MSRSPLSTVSDAHGGVTAAGVTGGYPVVHAETAPHARQNGQPRGREGFVLVTVLWIVLGLSVLGLVMNVAARSAIGTAQNRLAATRARWRAEACLEIARSAVADILVGRAISAPSAASWSTLDLAVAKAPTVRESGCALDLRPAGVALDVNAADSDALRTLFRAAGLPPLSSDSLADAILDWRDADDSARPLGAERAWYRSTGRFPPRNGPFADVRELRRVRGYVDALKRVPALDTLLTTETGRTWVGRAPLPVLAAVRGFGDEVLARVRELRSGGVSSADVASLAAHLSRQGESGIGVSSTDPADRVVAEPDAWLLTAHASSPGAAPVEAWVEVRLVHAGPRAAIVRRRTWP